MQLLAENQLVDRIISDDGFMRYGIGNMGDENKHHYHQVSIQTVWEGIIL